MCFTVIRFIHINVSKSLVEIGCNEYFIMQLKAREEINAEFHSFVVLIIIIGIFFSIKLNVGSLIDFLPVTISYFYYMCCCLAAKTYAYGGACTNKKSRTFLRWLHIYKVQG